MAVETARGLPRFFREFEDEEGRTWRAGVDARSGPDFKGRYFFVARPEVGGPGEEVVLEDLRWNSEETAQRTLQTMSGVELRRRLREGRGRTA